MLEFFKKMFRGLLLIIIAPFAIVFFAGFLVYAFFVFGILAIKSAFLFLKGGSILDPTDFDKAASDKLAEALAQKSAPAVQPIAPSPTIVVVPVQTVNAPANPGAIPAAATTTIINDQVVQIPYTEPPKELDIIIDEVGEHK